MLAASSSLRASQYGRYGPRCRMPELAVMAGGLFVLTPLGCRGAAEARKAHSCGERRTRINSECC